MPILTPLISFIRRRRRPKRETAALVLVAAAYDDVALTLTLTFDRAIDIAGLAAGAVVVHDGNILGYVFAGQGPGLLVDPATVRIALAEGEPWSSNETVFSATAGTGIVAVDDAGEWAGVTDVELPFP